MSSSKGIARSEVKAQRRRLAVLRVREGESTKTVARVLGVTQRAVQGWVKRAREGGLKALNARPRSGRPPKLSAAQEQEVLGWICQSPTDFGFATELWTARRVAQLIQRRFQVKFNSNYLVEWLARRKVTPQRPQRQSRERVQETITRWKRTAWRRIQKKR